MRGDDVAGLVIGQTARFLAGHRVCCVPFRFRSPSHHSPPSWQPAGTRGWLESYLSRPDDLQGGKPDVLGGNLVSDGIKLPVQSGSL